jgi:hypothetical protein
MAFGQKLVCLQTAQGKAQGPDAPLTGMTAAAKNFLITSLTLFLRSQNFKSLLRSAATSVTFTPNTTELNFIEQYWGAAKLHFCTAGRGATIEDMKKKVLASLDDIPIEQIHWHAKTFLTLTIAFLLHL